MQEKRTNPGFTIVELVVVIILIAIVAAVLVAKWPGNTISLNAQTRALASDIRYTQNLSTTKGVRYKLAQNSSTQYSIYKIDSPDVLIKTVNLGNGITFSSFPNGLIAFDGKGVPYITDSTPGTTLSSTLTISLTADGDSASVTVSPETGRVN